MTSSYQHIANKLNRRAEIIRDNQHMDEIERHATPLFYAVFGAAMAIILWHVTEDYRDVMQHRLDTLGAMQSSAQESALLARCANEEIVPFDDVMLQCKRIKLMEGMR